MFIGLGCSAAIPAVHCLILYGVTIVNQRIALLPWLLVQWSIRLLAGFIYAVSLSIIS
jgi:hypothetical protein